MGFRRNPDVFFRKPFVKGFERPVSLTGLDDRGTVWIKEDWQDIVFKFIVMNYT